MILTFTKLDGLRIGIDIDTIVDVEDTGAVRNIGTVIHEYEVIEEYTYIIHVVNSFKKDKLPKIGLN